MNESSTIRLSYYGIVGCAAVAFAYDSDNTKKRLDLLREASSIVCVVKSSTTSRRSQQCCNDLLCGGMGFVRTPAERWAMIEMVTYIELKYQFAIRQNFKVFHTLCCAQRKDTRRIRRQQTWRLFRVPLFNTQDRGSKDLCTLL